jgi:RND superfamily putative drug exporter
MVAVFLGFATEADVVVKMLGFGMAVAIFLDATVVRMVLVPATMALLGSRNWWLPTWLDRILPTVQAELGDDELVPVTETVEPAPADADDRVRSVSDRPTHRNERTPDHEHHRHEAAPTADAAGAVSCT